MTTSNDPRGRLAELYSARQVALATAASATGFTRRHFYDFAPSPQSEPQDDEIMGGGFHNSIDARPAAPDIERGSARIVWPLDLVQIGWALAELLGTPATTGAEAPYTHTWGSAGETVPTTTLERRLKAGAFDGVVGAVCRSLQFPVGADRGYTRVSGDYFVRQVLEQYADSVAGTPATPALSARVPRAVGVIRRDGANLGSVIAGDLTLANVLGEDAYHGSRLVDDVALEGRSAALNLTARFKGSAAVREMGAIPTGQYLPGDYDIELEWPLAASLKLTLTVRNVRFAKAGLATSGPGRLDIPLRGRAEIGTSADMITAVLVNSQASYA